MIKLACSLPKKLVVAASGGPDSMALLDFCRRGRRDVTALYVHHGTPGASNYRDVVGRYCVEWNIPFVTHHVPAGSEATEESWRDARLEFYRSFTSIGVPVATGHHLDDAVEWWIMTSLRGRPKLMAPQDADHGLLKPFLLTPKSELVRWCDSRGVEYAVDPTNVGDDNTRAILRRDVMPHLFRINPGLRATIATRIRGQLDI